MRGVVWAGVICIAVILGVGGYNVLRSNVLHGEVNARSLFTSVVDETDARSPIDFPGPHACTQMAQPREWECEVLDAEGSGGRVTYRVRVEAGSSCWDGVRGPGGNARGRPRRISGCVYMDE